jgi:hypothetical protein
MSDAPSRKLMGFEQHVLFQRQVRALKMRQNCERALGLPITAPSPVILDKIAAAGPRKPAAEAAREAFERLRKP